MMIKIKPLRLLFIFLLCTITIGSFAQPGSHDPSNIVKEGNRFWAFHTGNGIAVTSASDSTFKNWRNEGSIFKGTDYPTWINEHVPGFQGHFWAPDVIFMNGKWHVYYSCSTFGSSRSAIGLVTTPSLSSKQWTDRGMVTSTTESSNMNAIDPDVFKAKDGSYWMTYGSFWRGIVVTEIDSITGKPKNVNDITFIANGNPEAPAIVYEDNYYYLFFNRGACCSGLQSTYQIYVGRASNPKGPYYDKNGINCNNGGGSVFMHHDGRFIGPGHFGLYGDNLISYHYYDGFDNGSSKMSTTTLKWEKGWPVADYAKTGRLPEGMYKLKNKNSNSFLKTLNGKNENGTTVVIGADTNASTEHWIFKHEPDFSYKIYLEAAPSRTLEIPNCSKSQGNVVGIWDDLKDESPCQNWYIAQIRKNGVQSYLLYNRNSGLVLEVQNARKDENAPVVQLGPNGADCQEWLFVPLKYSNIDDVKAGLDLSLSINRENQYINVKYNSNHRGSKIYLYNGMGVMLYQGKLNENESSIPVNSMNQICIIKITDQYGQTINRKITF